MAIVKTSESTFSVGNPLRSFSPEQVAEFKASLINPPPMKLAWKALQDQIEELGWEEGHPLAIAGVPVTYRPEPFAFLDAQGREVLPRNGLHEITVDGVPISRVIGLKID